jgi:riboflavin kinase
LNDERKSINRIWGLRLAHIPILIELLSLGAKDSPIKISTIEISKRTGKSQQLASKHLLELEREGYVERFKVDRQYSIKLTERGLNQLTKLYLALKEVLEAPPSVMEIEGELFSGLGEGSYYVSLEGYGRQFIDRLGFDPYIGTLNLKLTSQKDRKLRRELEHYSGISIDGFKDEYRTYGGAKCFMAIVNDQVEGAVAILERSHYDESVLEVISPVNIREKLGLKDGNRVKVKIFLESS